MNSDIKKRLTIKESSFLCKYKLHSKLLESTIRSYIYKSIKSNTLNAIYEDGHYLILEADLNKFISENYKHLGFSYNPI